MNKQKLIMMNKIAKERKILSTMRFEKTDKIEKQIFAGLDDIWVKRYIYELHGEHVPLPRPRLSKIPSYFLKKYDL